ncbi:4-(cytidine 5'-diphospho)-2-C-methyl-D-erythritol kinase [Thioclava sp. IC9]|uniref:4-(cytidine 5'-diphospho)-2-C-methyl-D-erythritol kinase n=1 Tax=Thioclava sp. IC9 TaxID=1973007 RepID=UPI000B541464|nr:4-(cytidine 5'-diphospho)-2-C-methyl-D-erythritol kinase [Thioclava sp. IC9]OWY03262.1 4-(cytidine 5'-diphospho)-2-C-methyl-D-erythritol kinase [Thioclava sp. IC9]
MRIIDAFAPAKINLTLHVIGQRADGYHLLDSLVAFGPMGDRLVLRESDALSLSVAGPEAAGVPADPSNLVLKAASLLSRPAGQGAEIHLDKYLPPASGIGGGSSDAAAALRALAALWDHPLPAETAQLGADVPMCLTPRPQRVRGIGEALDLVSLPPLPALLVNPRVEVPTPAIFKGLDSKDNPPMPEVLPTFTGAPDCIDWLATQRNDLQAPAIASAPVIGEVLDALMTLPGCRLARMSGSGATCFALFETLDAAQAAEATLAQRHPGWWRASGMLGDQTQKAQPHSRASTS